MHFQAQTESCDVKLELEKIHQDVTLPVSIIYKDDDTLAHPSVGSPTRPNFTLRFSYFSVCFKIDFLLPPTPQTLTPFWRSLTLHFA